MKGFMYILQCSDGTFYTVSTLNIDKRVIEHQSGFGANYTKDKLPVVLVYFEEFSRIDLAFNREKQVQGWSRKKKEALINGKYQLLPELSKSKK
jgi:putative endonuclease